MTKLLIARQNFDAAEIEFADMLMEDHNNAALAYPDCASPQERSVSTVYINNILRFSSRLVSGSQADNHCRESSSLNLKLLTLLNSLTAFLASGWFRIILRSRYTCPVVTS